MGSLCTYARSIIFKQLILSRDLKQQDLRLSRVVEVNCNSQSVIIMFICHFSNSDMAFNFFLSYSFGSSSQKSQSEETILAVSKPSSSQQYELTPLMLDQQSEIALTIAFRLIYHPLALYSTVWAVCNVETSAK